MDSVPHLSRHYSQADLGKEKNMERQQQLTKFHRESSGTFHQGSIQQYQYYSFNKGEESVKESNPLSHKSAEQSGCDQLNTFRSNHELRKKYSSLYDQLKQLQLSEMAGLLVEEIEENQRRQREAKERERREGWLEAEIGQLREQLAEKREVVRKLCETESRNLDLIESLQCQANSKSWDPSDHYFAKYNQLQSYMNEYICSTKEAQEEMLKKLGQLHNEKSRLLAENDALSHALFQRAKLVGVLEVRLVRAEAMAGKQKQCNKITQRKLQRLQEQNSILKSQIQSLLEIVKGYEQFEVDINNKSNRQVSSSLEFIRERLNINLSLSQDRQETPAQPRIETGKNNFNSRAEETEALKVRVKGLNEEREKLLTQNSELMEDYQKLCQRVQALTKDNVRLGVLSDEGSRQIQKLKIQMGKSRKLQEDLQQQLERKDRNFQQRSTNISDSIDLSSLKMARNSEMSVLQGSLYNTKPAFTRTNGGYNHFASKQKENQSVKSINLN